ncbi:manganese and iron superoxide dismutase [Schizophyllum commune Tattone D]|nr:manganese and iron superoxide dismutase [Schizophyllum commune Loenen D]KAI5832724.1 manganese and iron superoxide dismutase [Schizophyllum commune Tattone D]
MLRGHVSLVQWRPRRLPTASNSLWGRVLQNNRRALHTVRPLPYSVEEGLGRFMPPQALKTVAVDYLGGLVERLNNEIRDTELENKKLVDVIIGAAQQENQVLAFNYGSLALNTSFFLRQLYSETHERSMSYDLRTAIRTQYGSLAQLKSAFMGAASGMFSSGFLWLVSDSRGNMGIVPTFGPGTLLIRSRSHLAASDADFKRPRSILDDVDADVNPVDTGIPAQTALSDKLTALNYGDVLYPLLCVPIYEHAWMSAGFGVWGREEWLRHMWSVVDWAAVSQNYTAAQPPAPGKK